MPFNDKNPLATHKLTCGGSTCEKSASSAPSIDPGEIIATAVPNLQEVRIHNMQGLASSELDQTMGEVSHGHVITRFKTVIVRSADCHGAAVSKRVRKLRTSSAVAWFGPNFHMP